MSQDRGCDKVRPLFGGACPDHDPITFDQFLGGVLLDVLDGDEEALDRLVNKSTGGASGDVQPESEGNDP